MRLEDRPSDRIHIEQLEVFAHVGVAPDERAAPQRLLFNITFWPARGVSPLDDDLSHTVDYAAVCTETRRFVSSHSIRLIETLADTLANHLLGAFAIGSITIELRKFVLPDAQYVSVTVTRERSTQ